MRAPARAAADPRPRSTLKSRRAAGNPVLGLGAFIAGQEWIFVVVVAVILLFGAKKIPELAKTFGKAKGEYEKGKIDADRELSGYAGRKGGGGSSGDKDEQGK